jgi:4-oxalocrotonate tautomerase
MCGVRGQRTMAAMAIRQPQENSVSLIAVKVIEGLFEAPQKREIVDRLTDAMVAIEGESMRHLTWCIVEEVAHSDWGIVVDDIRALARADDRA